MKEVVWVMHEDERSLNIQGQGEDGWGICKLEE